MGLGVGVNGWATKLDEVGVHVQKGAEQADAYACRIIDLLEEIRDATATGYDVDVFEYPKWSFTGTGLTNAKTQDGREGYVKIVKQIAIVAAAAADVDVYVGSLDDSGFVQRVSLAAAGRNSFPVNLPVPEGVPIFFVSSAQPVQVNAIIQRIKL